MKPKKLTEAQKYPHYVRLPKNAVSPSGSIYKHFDIKMQGRVLNTYSDKPSIVRSAEPFTLIVDVNGRVKFLSSTERSS